MLRRRRGAPLRGVLVSLMSVGLVTGCEPSPTATLFVGAASSMQATLQTRARAFEDQHPDVRVEVIGDSSSRLARQLVDGAPYDIFVSARVDLSDELHQAGITSKPVVIAAAGLALAYEYDPRRPSARPLSSIISGATNIGIADPSVPLGHYTQRWLSASSDRSQVLQRVQSFEANALAVERRLTAGEVSVAVVYTQQCATLPRHLRCMPIDTTPILYTSALSRASSHPTLARAFLREIQENVPNSARGIAR